MKAADLPEGTVVANNEIAMGVLCAETDLELRRRYGE